MVITSQALYSVSDITDAGCGVKATEINALVHVKIFRCVSGLFCLSAAQISDIWQKGYPCWNIWQTQVPLCDMNSKLWGLWGWEVVAQHPNNYTIIEHPVRLSIKDHLILWCCLKYSFYSSYDTVKSISTASSPLLLSPSFVGVTFIQKEPVPNH